MIAMPKLADLPPFWPHYAASRLCWAAGQNWHLQEMGTGPSLLLIHGAGGSLHSWRDLAPLLARSYHVIALDVAGHGYSQMGRSARYGLDQIAQDIAQLTQAQGWRIHAAIGHSAGAAIALRLSQYLNLRAVVGLNAALAQFDGVAGWLFPAMAKSLSLLPFAPHLAARFLGTPAQIDRLLLQTGAKSDAAGRQHYLTLAQRPAHIAATLSMMAAWDLRPLLADLPQITLPVLLLTGGRDGAVPPHVSRTAAQILPHGQCHILPPYGHLLPEEAAGEIAPIILAHLG